MAPNLPPSPLTTRLSLRKVLLQMTNPKCTEEAGLKELLGTKCSLVSGLLISQQDPNIELWNWQHSVVVEPHHQPVLMADECTSTMEWEHLACRLEPSQGSQSAALLCRPPVMSDCLTSS